MDHAGRALCRDHLPGAFARQNGFRALDDWAAGIIHSYELTPAKLEVDEVFLASLETIRVLAQRCRQKKPKRQPIGKIDKVRNLNGSRAQAFCEVCGQPSELEEFRGDESEWANDNGSARLSGRYCTSHKPLKPDGSYNKAYRQAIRSKSKFENELSRLERQSWSVSESRAQSGSADVDSFVHNIVAQQGIYPDEESELRNLASRLVKEKMTDRKKQIAVMLAAGMTAASISRAIGITRQAVGKAIKSIPSEFRFDNGGRQSQTKKDVLSSSPSLIPVDSVVLQSALSDSTIREIMLNDDGRLWGVREGHSQYELGSLLPSEALKLITWLGQSCGVVIDAVNPTISGDVPGHEARFAAAIAPIVENAILAIRKKS